MDDERRVVLYGNSLFLVSMEVSLQDKQGLTIVRLEGNSKDVGERLEAAHPDMVVFDLAAQPDLALTFLRDYPGLPVIGLDVSRSAVMVLFSQQYATDTAEDLANLIKVQTFPKITA